MMWGTSLVMILMVGVTLSQAATPTRPQAMKSEHDVVDEPIEAQQGIDIILDPSDPSSSVWTTLEHLQNENVQLRQDLEKQNLQLTSLVQNLQEEVTNSLMKQQEEVASSIMVMLEDLGKQMGESLQQSVQEVTRQVTEVRGEMEGIMRGQQEEEGMAGVVLEAVAEFEDLVHNVSEELGHLYTRTASLENQVATIQMGEEKCSKQLTAVQQMMDDLVMWVQRGQRTTTTPTPTTTTTTPTTTTTTPTPTTTTTTPTPTTTTTTTTTTPIIYYPRTSTVKPSTFSIPPGHDGVDSLITSLLVTRTGYLLIGDMHRSTITLSWLDSPRDVLDVHQIHRPWAMLELQDGTIAVTMEHEFDIHLLQITDAGSLTRVRTIRTGKRYYSIAQGPGDSLIVGSRREDEDSTEAAIDIISMSGQLERSVVHDVDFLVAPFGIRRFGDDMYVSDWVTRKIFRVNVYTGQAKFTLGDLDLSTLPLEQPRKIDVDDCGNVYVATGGSACSPRSFCIIQVTQSGSWKMMDEIISPNGGMYPYGLEVTSSQIIVSWGSWHFGWISDVASFALPECPEENDEIKPALMNVALNKPAIQSTYHPLYGHPERAVDGNKGTVISQCTHTADIDSNALRWWRVDLMGMFQVEAVTITNRGDCCGYRLVGFNIYVVRDLVDPSEKHHNTGELCLRHEQPLANGVTVRLECHQPIVGQYVSLVLPSVDWPLNFCELQVWGRPAPASPTPTPPQRQTTLTIIDEEGSGASGSGASGSGDVEYSDYTWMEI